jgi:hypothetical protein
MCDVLELVTKQLTNLDLPSEYRTNNDFVRKRYVDTVTESDEAFVWLVMESYYGHWRDETDGKAGAKKGFTTTASKRKDDFERYVGIVGESRETASAMLWSERLMEVANKEMMRSGDKQGDLDEDDDGEDEMTVQNEAKARVYLSYASRGLGDSSSDEDDDECEVAGV